MKSKQDYLLPLRKCTSLETLEKVIEKKYYEMPDDELQLFLIAADHRKAEITMGKLYDKVPKEVWRYVD